MGSLFGGDAKINKIFIVDKFLVFIRLIIDRSESKQQVTLRKGDDNILTNVVFFESKDMIEDLLCIDDLELETNLLIRCELIGMYLRSLRSSYSESHEVSKNLGGTHVLFCCRVAKKS